MQRFWMVFFSGALVGLFVFVLLLIVSVSVDKAYRGLLENVFFFVPTAPVSILQGFLGFGQGWFVSLSAFLFALYGALLNVFFGGLSFLGVNSSSKR